MASPTLPWATAGPRHRRTHHPPARVLLGQDSQAIKRLSRKIALVRASAAKETQLHRRVQLNLELQLQPLESHLAEARETL